MEMSFLVTLFLIRSAKAQIVSDVYQCSREEYQCFNGQCIPLNYFCDSRLDCTDASDEFDCHLECYHQSDLKGDNYIGSRNISSSGKECLYRGVICSNSQNGYEDRMVCMVYGAFGTSFEFCDIQVCRTGSIDCNFERDFCGWQQPREHKFLWTRHSGSSSNQKYSRDMNLGYFPMIQSTDKMNQNLSALLLSPTFIPAPSGVYCLSFSFYITGASDNSLIVYTQRGTFLMRSPLWKSRLTTGNTWKKAFISVSESTQFGIIIEGILMEYRPGSIAIDDILLEDGLCPAKRCPLVEFQCNDGTCIPAQLFCDLYPDCPDGSDETICHSDCLYPYDKTGIKYEGSINTTNYGQICVRWMGFSNRGFGVPTDAENSCRTIHTDIYLDEPWCFTSKQYNFDEYESCGIRACSQECLPRYDPLGLQYRGNLNVTTTGRSCLAWNDSMVGEDEVQSWENFCRNPDSRSEPWCFVESTDGAVISEPCRIRNCTPSVCEKDEIQCISGQCIKRSSYTEVIQQCYWNRLYVYMPTNFSCPNDLICRGSSQICLPFSAICNGIPECPYHDDESYCDTPCPSGCSCNGTIIACKTFSSKLTEISSRVTVLDLSENTINATTFFHMNFRMLVYLNLSRCEIDQLPPHTAIGYTSEYLRVLDLSYNNFDKIPLFVFGRLSFIQELYLDGNPIPILEGKLFNQLPNLKILSTANMQCVHIGNDLFTGLNNLESFDISSNLISTLISKTFNSLTKLRTLNLARNNLSETNNYFVSQNILQILNLGHNHISNLTATSFAGLNSMEELNLEDNNIIYLDQESFVSLASLRFLTLKNNKIQTVAANAFDTLIALQELNLEGNKIRTLLANTFNTLNTLRILNLKSNLLREVQSQTFDGLTNLFSLNLQGNSPVIFQDMFRDLNNLQFLYGDRYTICCVKPTNVKSENCVAPRDKISSCNNLIDIGLLSISIWFMAFGSLVGNVFVIIYRVRQINMKKRNSQSILVMNLGVSDILMGFYLSVIALIDLTKRGEYGLYDTEWRQSTMCTLSGIIATTSSEASAMFIFLITVDRVIVLGYPYSKYRMTVTSSCISVLIVWLVAVLSSLIPLLITSPYLGEHYYSATSVCISLPLSTQRSTGWEYSVGLFIGFNSVLFLGIILGQFLIYKEIITVGKGVANTTRAREAAVAKSLTFIVVTDVLCWVPIAVIGLITLSGVEVSSSVYAWVIVFVLPVNSALNPFLYTVSAISRERNRNSNIKPCENNTKTSTMPQRQLPFIPGVSVDSSVVDKHLIPLEKYRGLRSLALQDILLVATKLAEDLVLVHSIGLCHGNIRKETVCVAYALDCENEDLVKGAIHLINDGSMKERQGTDKQFTQDIKDYGQLIKCLTRELNLRTDKI